MPASYANFLISNGALFVPVYRIDAVAIAKIKRAVPVYDVVPGDSRARIEQFGNLHRVTCNYQQKR